MTFIKMTDKKVRKYPLVLGYFYFAVKACVCGRENKS